MDQQWLEMKDIRRRRLDGTVWIPLREQWEVRVGEHGHAGFREEYVSIATLAVSEQDGAKVERLTVQDLAVRGCGHHGAVDDSAYVQADVYDHFGTFSGVHWSLSRTSMRWKTPGSGISTKTWCSRSG